MGFVRSRYLLLSDKVYRDRSGRRTGLAYSARNAALFAVDEVTAGRLRAGQAPDLPQLAQLGAIVPDGEDELAAVLRGLREGSADPAQRGFTVVVTSYCNMACGYCGQEHHRSPAMQERLRRVATRVEAAIAHPATRAVNVTWFGGEPLLALRPIRELSARFVSAATVRGVAYTAKMATNGSLLTVPTVRALHDDCALTSMEVTLDGPQPVHDRRRVKRNGTGSYRHIVEVLARVVGEAVAPRLTISIRVNVDAGNEAHVGELFQDLAAHGLAVPQVSVHPVPVHSWGNDVSAAELDARRYATQEAQWLRLAQSLGLRFTALPTATRRTTCQATTRQGEIVDLQERVYSCSEHPLVPGVRQTGVVATLAELSGAGPRPAGMFDDWFDQVQQGGAPCMSCPLLPVCGGACPKLWREGHVPCPSMKFNWAQRLDLAAAKLGFETVSG